MRKILVPGTREKKVIRPLLLWSLQDCFRNEGISRRTPLLSSVDARPLPTPLQLHQYRIGSPTNLWRNLDPVQFWKKHSRSMQKTHHHRCHVIIPGSLCNPKFFLASLLLKCVVFIAVYSQFLICNLWVNVSSYRKRSRFYSYQHQNSCFFERLEE